MGKYKYLSEIQSIKVKAGMSQSYRKIKQMLYNMQAITKFNTQVYDPKSWSETVNVYKNER